MCVRLYLYLSENWEFSDSLTWLSYHLNCYSSLAQQLFFVSTSSLFPIINSGVNILLRKTRTPGACTQFHCCEHNMSEVGFQEIDGEMEICMQEFHQGSLQRVTPRPGEAEVAGWGAGGSGLLTGCMEAPVGPTWGSGTLVPTELSQTRARGWLHTPASTVVGHGFLWGAGLTRAR